MRVIQVPMNEEEIEELTSLARTLKVSRSDLIRRACRDYIHAVETARKDEAYVAGYRRVPEGPEFGAAAELMAAQRLAPEDWSE